MENSELMKLIDLINEETQSFNKFPLSALIKQAKKFEVFKEFSNFYSINIYHGYYWHLTKNPNFTLSDTVALRDMSSMSAGDSGINRGAVMLTSDLDYWDAYYNVDPNTNRRVNKRPYAVLFDAADVDPKFLKQVSRGFGNEVYLFPDKAKQLKQIGVYDIKYAKAIERKFHAMIPQSEKELYKLWKFANNISNEKY